MDALEGRQMLSVAVKNHVLVIEGERGDDQIEVRQNTESTVTVTVNGTVTELSPTKFSRIRIRGGRGSDTITVDAPVRALIFGGPGDDHLRGGDARDTLLGEGGDDGLNGDGGNDSLRGGDGNDYAQGEDGNDKVLGDAGNDTVMGNYGDDLVSGGRGDDTCYEGQGRDRVFGNRGNDRFLYQDNVRDLRDEDVGESITYEAPQGPIVGSGVTFVTNVRTSGFTMVLANPIPGSAVGTIDANGTLVLDPVTDPVTGSTTDNVLS